MDVPDDKTWTWDSAVGGGSRGRLKSRSACSGLVYLFGETPCSALTCAKTARNCSLQRAVGFEPADAQAWFDLIDQVPEGGRHSDAAADQRRAGGGKPVDQSAIVLGKAALQYQNSNQLEAFNAASGE